ncbi:MAG: PAS domain-containing protein [Actinomycetota bacterium]
MADAGLIVRLISVVVFTALAVSSIARYRTRRDRPSRWFGITFAELALVAIATVFLPDNSQSGPAQWAVKLFLVGFTLFPYLLYRFTAAFDGAPLRSELAAGAMTGVVVASVLAVPHIPGSEDELPAAYLALGVAVLVQWTTLTLLSAVRLWRAGTGRPTVTRRRLRMLAMGAGGMSALMVASVVTPDPASGNVLAIQSLGLLCGLAFHAGFTPPRMVRQAWRRPEEEAAREAESALMTATSEDEVARAVLPHLAAITGGESAGLYAADGRLIGAYGPTPPLRGAGLPEQGGTLQDDLITLEFPFGWLVVSAGPYTPFFGQEELALARALGSMASLALQRSEGFRRERDMRRQLAEAQELARIGSWEWDVAGDEVQWSDELYRLYGYEPGSAEATRERIADAIHPEDRDRVEEVVRRASESLRPFSLEHRIILPGGEVRYLHARGKVLQAGPDARRRLVGTAQDVTDRRESEERLRASETMFRSMLASAPDAVVGVDSDGRIVLANEQTERLFGYGADELLGRPVEVLLSDALRAAHVGHRNGYLQSPTTRPMGAGLELTGRRKDGTEVPVDISLSHMELEGGPLITAFIRDISGRREAEENVRRLRQAAARQRQALELNDDVVQGLTVALYAFELNQPGVARRAVAETLSSARTIVSDLLGAEDSRAPFGPGDLVRRSPVRLGPPLGRPRGAGPAAPAGSPEGAPR